MRADEEMVRRGFARETRRLHLAHVRRFYEHRLAVGRIGGKPPSHRIRGAFPRQGPEGNPSEAPSGGGRSADGAPNLPSLPSDPIADNTEVREWLLLLLRTGHSHAYANQALRALRFLHRRVLQAPAPVANIPRTEPIKALPEVLSPADIRRFLSALKTPKHRAIAMVLYSAGLRVSEAATLKVGDIDSGRGEIHIRQGEGRKDRYVMLSPLVLEALREYARVERPYDWLFPAGHPGDRHITSRAIQRQVSEAAKAAGIEKGVTPHVLKHSFATHLLEAGTGLRFIQELLGLSKINPNVIHTHLAEGEARNITSPIDGLFEEDD